jgi:DNA-binding transcriptional regulator YiaG
MRSMARALLVFVAWPRSHPRVRVRRARRAFDATIRRERIARLHAADRGSSGWMAISAVMVCASRATTVRVSSARARGAKNARARHEDQVRARVSGPLSRSRAQSECYIERMCPACESDRSTKASTRCTRDVAGVAFSATLPAWRCTDCDRVLVDDHVSRAFDRAIAVDIAQRGPTNGETFRFLRARLTLSRAELAAILEVEPSVLRRWEEDASNVERLAWLVVAGLVLESIDASASTSVRIPGASSTTRTEAEIRLPWDRDHARAAG